MHTIGIRFGLSPLAAAAAQEIIIYQADDLAAWGRADVTTAAAVSAPLIDPATGFGILDVFEDTATQQHNLGYQIPITLIQGRRYRFEADVMAIADRKLFLYCNQNSGSYIIGAYGSTTPDISNQVILTTAISLGGGLYRMGITFDKADATTGTDYFIIGLSQIGVNTFYAGDVTKGFKVGRVSVIDVPK